jgi:hypothetical protein
MGLGHSISRSTSGLNVGPRYLNSNVADGFQATPHRLSRASGPRGARSAYELAGRCSVALSQFDAKRALLTSGRQMPCLTPKCSDSGRHVAAHGGRELRSGLFLGIRQLPNCLPCL